MARGARDRRSAPSRWASTSGRRRLSRLRWSPWPRRVLALALLLAAVVVVQGSTPDDRAPDPVGGPATVAIVVAARDLPAGLTLTADDLAVAELPDGLVPSGAVQVGDEPIGRMTSGPVRAGEALTDVRTIGPGYLAALPPDTAAVPLRLSDPGVSRLLRAGDRIDVYAGPRGSPPGLVVAGALVLAVESTEPDSAAIEVGPLLLVAVPVARSAELAGSAADGIVTATLAPP